jgi:hypothetical protein
VRHSQIARIMGCSRERIRQLDKLYFGLTGRERNKARRIDNSKVPPNHLFVTVAKERGYHVEALPLTNLRASKKIVLVNGFRCGLFSSSSRILGRNTYWTLRRSTDKAEIDFYVWSTPMGFIIIPNGKQPKDSTCIALNQKRKPGAYSHRHDYVNYLNKWDQLERKQRKSA